MHEYDVRFYGQLVVDARRNVFPSGIKHLLFCNRFVGRFFFFKSLPDINRHGDRRQCRRGN